MDIKFTVVKSTPNKTGGHVWKLEAKDVVKCFGVEKTVKRTYYIGGMPAEGKLGTEIVENMSNFEVKEYEFAHPESGEMMNLKWIHIKTKLDRIATRG